MPWLQTHRVREQSQAASNFAAIFTSRDNNDYSPSQQFTVASISIAGTTNSGSATTQQGVSWLPDLDARTEIDPSNIVNWCCCFPTTPQLGIYHCPADQSTLETPNGTVGAAIALAELQHEPIGEWISGL
jgi:hypothetical protein